MKVFCKSFAFDYRTRFLSEATIFYILISILFRYLVPLTIVWCTDSMWIKQATFNEMPTVEFKRRMIMIVEGEKHTNNDSTKKLPFRQSFTTFSAINGALERSNEYLQVELEDYEIDHDNDGRLDRWNLKIVCQNAVGSVRKVELLLFADYGLSEHIDLKMESVVYINKHHWNNAKMLTIDGTLALEKRRPFFSAGYDFRYNQTLISQTGMFINHDIDDHDEDDSDHEKKNDEHFELFNLETLVQRYYDRDYFLHLKQPLLEQWKSKTLTEEDNNFVVNLQIRIEPESFVYETSFGYLLKWALIQYVTIYLIVDRLITLLENAIYCKWFIFPTVRFANEDLKYVYSKCQ